MRIGNPTGRRLTWSSGELRFKSDGLALDSQGMVLQTSSTGTGDLPRVIRWVDSTDSPTATYTSMYDCNPCGGFFMNRGTGQLKFVVNNSVDASVLLQAGESGIPRATVRAVSTASASYVEIGGISNAGALPLRPQSSGSQALGDSTHLWSQLWVTEIATGTALFPVVSENGQHKVKNDGTNGSFTIGGNCTLTFEFGILVGRSGAGCP
jgi:hypothetical protein